MPQAGFDPPGEKWQLCLNIVVALPPKPPQLDKEQVFWRQKSALNIKFLKYLMRLLSSKIRQCLGASLLFQSHSHFHNNQH